MVVGGVESWSGDRYVAGGGGGGGRHVGRG